MTDVTAFVLAGGQSSRMGTEKAFLELHGRTLLERALEVARGVGGEVRIVGKAEKFSALAAVVEDVFPQRGPLGGIHAALGATATELNLVLAVDMPFVSAELLRYIVEQARASGAMVTVPRAARGLQPLCAVYRREFRERAEEALRAGHNKIDPLFTPAETRIVGEAELARLGFAAAMFDNLNTREDWERASVG